MDDRDFVADLKLDFDRTHFARSTTRSATGAFAPMAMTSTSKSPVSSRIIWTIAYVRPALAALSPARSIIIVIGGGFGGLLAGARFHEAGIKDVRIIESGGDFGGTGTGTAILALNVTSRLLLSAAGRKLGYTPGEYSFAPESTSTHSASPGTTTFMTTRASRRGLRRLRWDAEAARWIVSTVVATRCGPALYLWPLVLSIARNYPPSSASRVPGPYLPTSRWDYEYTGGDHSGSGLTKLADKRVAVIGTSATAIQCVPFVDTRKTSLCLPANAVVGGRARNKPTVPNGSRA